MCGIVGVLGLSDRRLIERMKKAVAHRGPDQHGTYMGKSVMLGHQRLSILDLSEKGRQPMADHEGNVVVFNGEIYNHKALRGELEKKGYRFVSQSDTEVLVHGFSEWKNALPEKLDGEYAFAAWNEDRRELLLARDALGVVPLYVAKTRDAFFFASEPKAFFEFEGIQPKLNSSALDSYLTYRYPVAPDTLFEGIQKVRPGHALTVNAKIRQRRFYVPPTQETAVTATEAQARIQALFAASVKKRLQSDVPLGAYLSGGLDSSFIVAQMSQWTKPRTFSVAFGAEDDETPFVEEIVSHYDTIHTPLHVEADRFDLLPQITWHLDAPAADIAALPTYLMAQATKKYATVVLTGDGGDEVFAGYNRYQRLLALERIRKIPATWTRAAALFLPKTTAARLTEAMHAKSRAELVVAYSAAYSENEKTAMGVKPSGMAVRLAEEFFKTDQTFLNQMLAMDQATLLPDDYLLKVNTQSMAHGVEARVPFLDTALVNYAATLPASLKATWKTTRIIQRRAMKAMGVPEKILKRKKHGFNVPTASWLKQGLIGVAEQCFESLDQRKLMKPGAGQRVLKQFDESPAYFTRQFWTLLGLELWCRVYLDCGKPVKPKWKL
ncbi:asparagine synthase (glutamine-hydrolyzing) [Candidatus Micrarchaeota archaeon]|nr:asparagine synthase (glutamine-hydrolyzing) [Candidatus Micrarchaeota archaeon]